MHDPIQRHPTRAEQLDILVALIADHAGQGEAVLDLGCGTGYVGWLLLQRRPDLAFVGVDRKPESLAEARANLAGFGELILVEGDLARPEGLRIPDRPYRFVQTCLTFHDLDDAAKQALIRWSAERLAPGGWFLLYDRVRLTEPALFPLQQTIWRRIEREHGAGMRMADSWGGYEADLRPENRPAALGDYLRWLGEAGLRGAVLHMHGNVGLIAGGR